jgi:hypothetical protein
VQSVLFYNFYSMLTDMTAACVQCTCVFQILESGVPEIPREIRRVEHWEIPDPKKLDMYIDRKRFHSSALPTLAERV